MKALLLAIGVLPFLSGCTSLAEAYWQKPTRYKELPQVNHGDPAVAALVLDGSRRLVISQRAPSLGDSAENANANATSTVDRHTGSGAANGSSPRFTCPEPPPDAVLSALYQQLTTLQSGDRSLSHSEDFKILAQAIANRTSTVEVWRTTSSMYCVLLMNGASNAANTYLTGAATALARTNDTTSATSLSTAGVQELIAAAFKKKADDEKAAEKKRCDALAADKRAADQNCVKLAAAAN